MQFDRQNLKTIRSDLDAALAEVAKKHGIVFTLGNIRFSATEFRASVNASVVNATAAPAIEAWVANNSVQSSSVQVLRRYGIDPSKVSVKGDRIIDYTPRKPKYPVIYTTVRGARYKISIEDAKRKWPLAA